MTNLVNVFAVWCKMGRMMITPETLGHALLLWPKWKISIEEARSVLGFPQELSKRTLSLYGSHLKCPNGCSLEPEELGYKVVPGKQNWEEWDNWINGPKNASDVPLAGRQLLARLGLPQNFLRFWMSCFYSEYEDSQGNPNLAAIFPPDHEYQLRDGETGQVFYATLRKETLTTVLLPQLFKYWDDKYPPTPDMVVCSKLSPPEDKGETAATCWTLWWSDKGEPYMRQLQIGGSLAPIVLYCPMSGHTETLELDSLTELGQRITAITKYQHSLLPRSLIFYIRQAKEGIEERARTKAIKMALDRKSFDEILHELYFNNEVQANLEIEVNRYTTAHERLKTEMGFRKNFRDRIYKWLRDAGLRPSRAKRKWWKQEESKNTT